MGMFDSFYVKVICPYCGKESVIEFQTKDFECSLKEWKQGEPFESDCIEIVTGIIKDCYGSCESEECHEYRMKRHGFGRRLYADILIENTIVKGAINIRIKGEK